MSSAKRKGSALGSADKRKQGTLFSFFKKVTPESSSSTGTSANNLKNADNKKSSPAKISQPDRNNTPKTDTNQLSQLWTTVKVGDWIEVFWPDDNSYYIARVKKHQQNSARFYVEYEQDGQCEWADLAQETFRYAQEKASKRRRIQQHESDDEEHLFDMDEEPSSESEESAYQQKEGDDADDDDDDDQWMVTDDEQEEEKPRKKTKKEVKVIAHKPSSKTPAKKNNSLSTLAADTPQHVTPGTGSKTGSHPTPTTPFQPKTVSNTPTSAGDPPMFSTEKGVANPAGSHVHHHLRFIQRPCDAQGRASDHPDFDPRTLKIDFREWERVTGSKMTNAVQQWWDLKAQYFDTVLLFKTGKFYEIFHMDADIGVQVLGLKYMKGSVAHVGFPESAYASMADKLVRAGYKVARVEQTETPEMLKERKANHKGKGPKPQVVNREVCSILTSGTRTFCYLEDDSQLSSLEESSNVGPLLAIREVLFETNETTEEESSPVCEYGITLVDAVRGHVTIGQFADDVLRSRMNTVLATFAPSEILLQGGHDGASDVLKSLVHNAQKTSLRSCNIDIVRQVESFPKSTAIDPNDRRILERTAGQVRPWDVDETLQEIHRKSYYPRGSMNAENRNISRWPQVLRAAIEGKADLALSSLGAAIFYLQRNLIDHELLSMGIVKAYVPPISAPVVERTIGAITEIAERHTLHDFGSTAEEDYDVQNAEEIHFNVYDSSGHETEINHMSLDGTTLHNLEILHNSVDHKVAGSLWSKINHTKTPHGSRLLRAWLLRPLFRKEDIERRADAVEELVSGGAAIASSEASSVLAKCNDIERLLSRVHSMSGNAGETEGGDGVQQPSERAVLYEAATYTKRKVGDFSKVLNGLRHATKIPEIFDGVEIKSRLLQKVVRFVDGGGCFPNMTNQLDWFFENFDCEKAAKGLFEPNKGIDALYDESCELIERIEAELNDYKEEMCSSRLSPRSLARSSWKYINTKADSKDKYIIELPASVSVPDDFIMKGKRGSGAKQINKYRTAYVESLVGQLERALDTQKERKSLGMQLIFAKFDSMRSLWAAAAQATAMLDALGSLAQTSSKAGYTRPQIIECPLNQEPLVRIVQGRHPVVEDALKSTEFVPNDLELGRTGNGDVKRVLLLSGCNMGGKSTLLRQTCLIAILAQIGCFVPAEICELTPIDKIFTRLGASDRILIGQSTFFVELAETAAALRGATRRSLVIMDELGRGTSTFDGTAIASATVKHLAERSKCLSLFATHYHSLLEEWKTKEGVRLGHMECIVDNGCVTSRNGHENEGNNITFLYTLGEGICPKSFGINVARLAGLPDDVLVKAQRISTEFEEEMNGGCTKTISARSAPSMKGKIEEAIKMGNWASLNDLWQALRN